MSQPRCPTPGPSGLHTVRLTAPENAEPIYRMLKELLKGDLGHLVRELGSVEMAKEALILALEKAIVSVFLG